MLELLGPTGRLVDESPMLYRFIVASFANQIRLVDKSVLFSYWIYLTIKYKQQKNNIVGFCLTG